MEKQIMMLACDGGGSTSLLVSKMQSAAEAQGRNAEIFAVPVAKAEEAAEARGIDVLLLGPQVRFREKEFREKLKRKNIPVGVIPMIDYGIMNGAKVLAFADELLKG